MSELASPEQEEVAGYQPNTPAMHANLQSEFLHSVSKYTVLLVWRLTCGDIGN